MRHHTGNDTWKRDSYNMPDTAVVGCSHTGEWSDSPCPTALVKKELGDFQEFLKANKVRSNLKATESGNIFCTKIWVVVHPAQFEKAQALAKKYLVETVTTLLHDAEN